MYFIVTDLLMENMDNSVSLSVLLHNTYIEGFPGIFLSFLNMKRYMEM